MLATGPFVPVPNTPRTEEKGQGQLPAKEDNSDQLAPMQTFGKQSKEHISDSLIWHDI